ncbi:MAG: BrnA antitoxin family protein [Bauldia litoralis]
MKIRPSQDVPEHFRAGDPGWQTRINQATNAPSRGKLDTRR